MLRFWATPASTAGGIGSRIRHAKCSAPLSSDIKLLYLLATSFRRTIRDCGGMKNTKSK